MSASEILKNTITWLILAIILPVPILALFAIKMLITIIAKLRYLNLCTFSISDTMTIGDFFYTRPLVNIGIILKINGNVDITELRQLFQTQLLDPRNESNSRKPLHKNLFCYVQRFCGYNFKRMVESINVKEHIIEKKLKPVEFNALIPNEGTETTQELSDLVNSFFYAPHTFGKPFWEVFLVKEDDSSAEEFVSSGTTYTKSKTSLLLFKIHHCFADGYSLIYLFDLLTGNKAPVLTKPFNETLWDKVKLIAGGPTILQNFLYASSDFKNPFQVSGKNTRMNYFLVTLDLTKIKTIRKQALNGKTHVHSILLTVLGGVFRRLLLEQDRFSAEEELPEYIYIASALPWPDHPRNKMCNEWTVGGFKVPIRNSNPLERLSITEDDYNAFFKNGSHKVVKRLMVPLMSLFPACMTEKMGDADIPVSSSCSTNVAGDDYTLLGHPIEHIYPFVGHTSPKMTWVTISMSHSGKIDITIGVNNEFMEFGVDLSRISNTMLNEEVEHLAELVEAEAWKNEQ